MSSVEAKHIVFEKMKFSSRVAEVYCSGVSLIKECRKYQISVSMFFVSKIDNPDYWNVEERRKFKNRAERRYKEQDRLIKSMCINRKEKWLHAKHDELELLERNDSRLLAGKIREITGKRRLVRTTIVKDQDGTIFAERSYVLRRWKNYVGELYSDNEKTNVEIEDTVTGFPILRSEVELAVKKIKLRNSE